MTEGQIDSLKQKARNFFETKEKIYIKKKNGFFNIGQILELEGDLIILNDRVLGAIQIYMIEILEIEKAKEEENKNAPK